MGNPRRTPIEEKMKIEDKCSLVLMNTIKHVAGTTGVLGESKHNAFGLLRYSNYGSLYNSMERKVT